MSLGDLRYIILKAAITEHLKKHPDGGAADLIDALECAEGKKPLARPRDMVREGCNYLSPEGQICNKCGRLHDTPFDPLKHFGGRPQE
jgi:hypothetical protein